MFQAVRSVFSAHSSRLISYRMPSLGKLLPLVTAGILISGSSAIAAPKQPIKAEPTHRPILQTALQTTQTAPAQIRTIATDITTPSDVSTVSGALADGFYFFGAAPERDQLGFEYVVFEVTNDQVVGAFYLPSSNFDCFQGEVRPNQLALSITDSYDQAVHSYSLAMETVPAAVAGSAAGTFGPAGFYSLGQPGDLEHELLSTCQATYVDAI